MTENEIKTLAMTPGCVPDCPGCAHRQLNRFQSHAKKEQGLKKILSGWESRFEAIHGVAEPFRRGYRGKVCLSTRWENGKWQFGMVKHDTVIPIHDCPVHTRQIRESVLLLTGYLPGDGNFPLAYFVQTGCQVTLVVKSAIVPDLSWLDASLEDELARIGIEGLWLHLNPCTGKKIFAKNKWYLLYGTPRSVDSNRFVYGPKAFQQLIPSLYDQAMDAAQTFLAPSLNDLFVDLYCGIGMGLARWQKHCRHIIGVELDAEAIDCAEKNAPDTDLLRGRCSHRIPQLNGWTNDRPHHSRRLLYVNPPRTGLEPEILQWIVSSFKPHRIAYLSCSAGTLKRDLTFLEANGYEAVQIIPYDFFPQTHHVETMVLIRTNPDNIHNA